RRSRRSPARRRRRTHHVVGHDHARALVSSSPNSEARELTAEEVERGYNNRAAVPDHPAWFARWAQLSDAARAHIETHENVRYGAGPKETLDIFLPATAARGTLLFIHGGY